MREGESPTREQVAEAVFGCLLRANGFSVIARRVRLPPELREEEMPALFLWGDGVDVYTAEPRGVGMKRVLEMHASVVFRFRPDNSNWRTGSEVLNPLIDEIERVVMQPDDVYANANTLGGIVHRCWIEGKVSKATGDIDPEGLGGAIVPIKVMIP